MSYINHYFMKLLHSAGIKHDTDPPSNGLRRQVASERASNDSIGPVGTHDLTPIDTVLFLIAAAIRILGDKGHFFAMVKFGIFFTVDALDFNKADIIVLSAETSLESKHGTIHVQTGSFGHGGNYRFLGIILSLQGQKERRETGVRQQNGNQLRQFSKC